MGERMTKLSRIFNSSEMYCSLKFEDVRGCPYNMFTKKSVALLTLASMASAFISLLTTV